ncbi:hypothetical protein [Nocardioides gilvus]|uniref:hypothetical protein n=1 Tax=Nocardioides gilvus TaxID=1735589 RepID=UPI000D7473DD|nr:hypothetical protein [Nocardioides gilvus]
MLATRGVDVCTEYGVALAVEDFVPCILATGALVVLALMVRERVPKAFGVAALGALLIGVGGFGKATWKLLVATGCWEYPLLEQLLFPCIAFGFAAMAWALLSAVKGQLVLGWPFVAFPLAAAIGALWMGDTWPLLIAAAVGATLFGVTAAVTAFKAGKTSVGILFIIYVLGTNILPPLAAQPRQSEEIQWAEQLTNSGVQLCFLLGALWLREHLTKKATTVAVEKTGAPA